MDLTPELQPHPPTSRVAHGSTSEVGSILEEMATIDARLATPGAFVAGDRDGLLARRRSLQVRFDALQERPDYLDQVAAYTRMLQQDLPLSA